MRMDRSSEESLPESNVGGLTIVPVIKNISPKPKLSSTKIGMLKYVRRDFDFQSLRVIPDEDEDLQPVSKEDVGGQGKMNGSANAALQLQQKGEAWIAPEAVDYNGYITYILKPLSSKTSYYTYYLAGVDSPMPNLQVQESAHSCENSFNFRSKMYCQNEQDRLCLPYEIRCAIYAYAFRGPTARGVQQTMLKTLPTVCRFLYVDLTTFINQDHFQLYFAHPLTLQGYLQKLGSATTKQQLNLTRLHCVIVDLSQLVKRDPGDSPPVTPTTRNALPSRCLQTSSLNSSRPSNFDGLNSRIRAAHKRIDPWGREPADWIPALTELLETYQISTLVIRVGKGNVLKWKRLPQCLRELVQVSAVEATEWQVVKHVGGWKRGKTA